MATPCFFDEAQLAHPGATVGPLVAALRAAEAYDVRRPDPLPAGALHAHEAGLVALYRASARLRAGVEVRPRVYQPPSAARRSTVEHIGDWAFDDRSPLSAPLWKALRGGAACALSAAAALMEHGLTYAVCDPGGHHAGPARFGGGSYVNHAALAARALSHRGPGVVLDIAAHHGNGTQAFFYDHPHVLVISVHEDPRSAYPYVSGFPDEFGVGPGRGRNVNLPQAPGCDGDGYQMALNGHVAPMVRSFEARWMVLSMGVDTHRDAPGTRFALTTEDLRNVGRRIGQMGLPIVAVHEPSHGPPDGVQASLALLEGLRAGRDDVAS